MGTFSILIKYLLESRMSKRPTLKRVVSETVIPTRITPDNIKVVRVTIPKKKNMVTIISVKPDGIYKK